MHSRMRAPHADVCISECAQGAGGGRMGVVVSHPLSLTARECLGRQRRPFLDSVLFRGGPVRGGLAMLHDVKDVRGSIPVGEESGLYFGGDIAHIEEMCNPAGGGDGGGGSSSGRFKFMLGYCGWKEGQLEEEMRSGAWVPVAAASPEALRSIALMGPLAPPRADATAATPGGGASTALPTGPLRAAREGESAATSDDEEEEEGGGVGATQETACWRAALQCLEGQAEYNAMARVRMSHAATMSSKWHAVLSPE